MKIGVIHISDIHITKGTKLDKASKIVASLRSLPSLPEKIYLIFTGDIAFSGQQEEYEIAKKLILEISNELQQTIGVYPKIVAVPGNHDCLFPNDQYLRNKTIEDILEKRDIPESSEAISKCVEIQDQFFKFIADLNICKLLTGKERLFWIVEDQISPQMKLSFLCLNTAWLSKKHEEQGKLYFPEKLIDKPQDASIVIGLMHHPYPWFAANNHKALRRNLEDQCDLIFSGHEHDGEVFSRKLPSKNETDYTEGFVFKDSDSDSNSAFMISIIDYSMKTYSIFQAKWADNQYHVELMSESTDKGFLRLEKRKSVNKDLCDDFWEFLNDPGMNLSHPRKKILLEDFYDFPSLKSNASLTSKEKIHQEVIESKDIVSVFNEKEKILVYGDESVGKTALCKSLFRRFFDLDFYPILIEGKRIRNTKPLALLQLLEEAIECQYKEPQREAIIQLSRENLICLIDDFQACQLNIEGKSQFIEQLQSRFSKIFIFSSQKNVIEEAIADGTAEKVWPHYKSYEILPLGHLQRRRLIEKWLKLGREDTIEKDELAGELNENEKNLNTILGNNVLPSYPIFVLTVMQQLETKNPISTASGAYGYYYQFLVDFALHKTSQGKPEDVNTKTTFLSELAWCFLRDDTNGFDEDEMTKFVISHWSRYRLSSDSNKMLTSLLESRLIRKLGGQFSFPYKYLFYFFCAKYMQNHFISREVNEKIDSIVSTLHREESANILIFLTYLTKSDNLIEKILSASKSIYGGVEACDLDKDVEFIGKYNIQAPQILIEDSNPEQNKESHLKRMDHFEAQQNRNSADNERKEVEKKLETDQDLKELYELNRAYKACQILGQVLRNFHGSLLGEQKERLAQECLSVVLRSLKVYFQIFEKHFQTVVVYLADVFDKNFIKMKREDQQNFASHVLFIFSELACLRAIKHVAYSVGSNDLKRTYEDLQRADSTLSQDFVMLAVQLDNFKAFPEKALENILKRVQHNILGKTLLQMLVAEHFHLCQRDFKIRQKICAKVGIQVTPRMLLGGA